MKDQEKFVYAVCDGHGINGHLVSQFVKKMLPYAMEAQLKNADNVPEVISTGNAEKSAADGH